MARLPLALMVLLLPAGALAQGASARLTYDAANLGLNSGDGYKTSSNATGTLAWGEAYIMMSHAAMYRGTGDATYLDRLADHALSVLAQRDSVLGLTDYAGSSRPCWQATKYSDNGLPYCWAVHTGMITYPMADLVYLVGQDPALKSRPVAGGTTLGQVAQQVLVEVEQCVATHDFQYQSGPAAGEGHYIGDPAAAAVVPALAGKALPLNQMNALGRTLVLLWQTTGKTSHQQRAAALCTYLKSRMTKSGAAYVWTYWGTPWSAGKGEDTSHAAINADFAHLCFEHGLVFSAQDMKRLGRTLFDNIHTNIDTVADRVDGSGTTNNYRWAVGRWLALTPHEARVWAVAANLYRDTTSTTIGSVLLGLANITRHAPPLRGHSFYHVDWNDLGTYRKATAYGANLLLLPPAPATPAAMAVEYRAAIPASIDQWDGSKYHANQRLPARSAFTRVFAPYDPLIHYAYSGSKVLYQLTDSFVAGKGIEVQEADAVQLPQILTSSAPEATVDTPYSLALQGSGDAPLLWSLHGAPAGMTVDLQSGLLSWTPTAADVPGVQVTVRLTNDAGQAQQVLSIVVRGVGGADAGGDGPAADGPGTDAAPVHDLGVRDAAQTTVPTEGSCGCRVGAPPARPGWIVLLLASLLLRRRS